MIKLSPRRVIGQSGMSTIIATKRRRDSMRAGARRLHNTVGCNLFFRQQGQWSQLLRRPAMECQRCSTGKEAKYRVYTDIIDMKVCAACADEARRLGIGVEVLN